MLKIKLQPSFFLSIYRFKDNFEAQTGSWLTTFKDEVYYSKPALGHYSRNGLKLHKDMHIILIVN